MLNSSYNPRPKKQGQKFKLIMPAYLLALFAIIAAPVCIRWLFEVIQLDVIKLDTLEIWMPMISILVFISWLLKPRIALLSFKNERSSSLYLVFTGLFAILPAILIQNIYTTATHPLVPLNVVQDLDSAVHSRYYHLKHLSIVGNQATNFVDVRTGGSRSRQLVFSMYTVVPFTVEQSVEPSKRYWLGFKHVEWISRKEPEDVQDRLYRQFVQASWADLREYDLGNVRYVEKLSHSTDREFFIKAIENGFDEEIDERQMVVLVPKLEAYDNRNGDLLFWFSVSLIANLVLFMGSLLIPPLCPYAVKRFARKQPVVKESIADFLIDLLPQNNLYIPSFLMLTHLFMFLVMWFSGMDLINPTGAELLSMGANRGLESLGGDWWRLVTSLFLHGNVMQLLFSLFGLMLIAQVADSLFSNARIAILFFCAGIIANFSSAYWFENTVTIGPSGGILGIMGAMLVLMMTRAVSDENYTYIKVILLPYIGFSLLFGFLSHATSAANAGGLLSGAILGLLLYNKPKNRFRDY